MVARKRKSKSQASFKLTLLKIFYTCSASLRMSNLRAYATVELARGDSHYKDSHMNAGMCVLVAVAKYTI